MTQDCDLKQDYTNRNDPEKAEKQDQYLQSILICPAYPAETFRAGQHLKSIGLIMEQHNSKMYPLIKKQRNIRYHYFPSDLDKGIQELIIDFKHYYSLPRDYFYNYFPKNYVATISPLFRESLSDRFTHYLARIGLPEIEP
jgi:hypothetical protein